MSYIECEVKALKKDIPLAKRCPNTAREFLEYEIEKDTNGNFKGCFPDKNNHSIDAVRYSREFDMRNVKIG